MQQISMWLYSNANDTRKGPEVVEQAERKRVEIGKTGGGGK